MLAVQKYTSCALLGVALALSGCTTAKESNPSRTAMEELLISTAAERAADQMKLPLPKGAAVYVDASNFEGTDSKYAVGAVRGSLLLQGYKLVADKKDADVTVEIRAGALSTDNSSFLVGIPTFTVPMPFAATGLTMPEIALYKSQKQTGVAKLVADAYDQRGAHRITPLQATQYGFAHNDKHTVMIFVSWTDNDADPDSGDVTPQTIVHGIEDIGSGK